MPSSSSGGGRGMGEEVENLVDLCEESRVAGAESQRVGRVSGHALDAVENQFLQVRDLLAFGEKADRQKHLLALRQQAFERGCGFPCGRAAEFGGNECRLRRWRSL